jgi:hypothetical protein
MNALQEAHCAGGSHAASFGFRRLFHRLVDGAVHRAADWPAHPGGGGRCGARHGRQRAIQLQRRGIVLWTTLISALICGLWYGGTWWFGVSLDDLPRIIPVFD